MQQSDFVNEVTAGISSHLAGMFAAPGVAHRYAENLHEQMIRVSTGNPTLTSLQVLSVMFAEDPQSNVFEVAFDELKDGSKKLLAIKFSKGREPKVLALVLGN